MFGIALAAPSVDALGVAFSDGHRVAMPAVMLTPSLRSVASITAGYSKDTLRVILIVVIQLT